VTGPTGSGKTTTLYSIINRLKAEHTNIITVEDPIEYKLAGVNQVQVNEKAGLTFANTLRSVLRQDPDIILVGEIRDRETADIAFQAALTGHLVLTTLHTNDTLAAVARLRDMGLEPFKLAPGLLAITSQRLVRRLCPACRVEIPPDRIEPGVREFLKRFDQPPRAFEAKGCDRCEMYGFKGRFSVLELLETDAALKAGISSGAAEGDMRKTALASGVLHPLAADAAWHLSNGDTTFSELFPHLGMKKDGSGTAKASAAGAASAAKAKARSGKPKILVADDTKALRDGIREILEMNGYEVDETSDGQQTVVRIAARTPDCLLLDLQMPGLDGNAVLRAVRQTMGLISLPVIMLTGCDDDKSQEQAFLCGADDYIIKPFKPPLLLARIRAVLHRHQLAAQ
jgi:type IV pilus assembly protein PilB